VAKKRSNVKSVSRFTATVDLYVKYHPKYPARLMNYLKVVNLEAKVVVELGAGTGIFTRQLAECYFASRIIAVEPNDHMRTAAELTGEKVTHGSVPSASVEYVKGTAENTGLPPHVADINVGAQCFHLFDLDKTVPEISRISKPHAFCCAIWNDRSKTSLNKDLDAAVVKYDASYKIGANIFGTVEKYSRFERSYV